MRRMESKISRHDDHYIWGPHLGGSSKESGSYDDLRSISRYFGHEFFDLIGAIGDLWLYEERSSAVRIMEMIQ